MPPRVMGLAAAATSFARTRWGRKHRTRAALEAWQQRQLRHFLRDRLTRAPFYAEIAGRKFAAGRGDLTLADLPIVDKQTLLTHFDGLNTREIRYDDAMAVAMAAERSRDFRPELGDVTVGLSSGTSGQRVPFLVSGRERMLWASAILARMLRPDSLTRLAAPWRPPLAIAFFLRANSNLYTTLDSRRVDVAFYDLLQPLDRHVDALMSRASSGAWPDVLVAPATVLRQLADLQLAARGRLRIRPSQVISVAETLEEEDAVVIERAFGVRVQQIYQATEGFLGYTCEAGTIHLNEECVHIEPEWLDAGRTRFHPIVTDFTRETQMIVRYRLDDVLRVKGSPCRCGRASLALAGIDGRRDAVLMLEARGFGASIRPSNPSRLGSLGRAGRRADEAGFGGSDGAGATCAIFPDVLRRAMMLGSGDRIRDYRIVQTGSGGLVIRLALAGPPHADAERQAEASVRTELEALFTQQDVVTPPITFAPWQPEAAGDKCCRIRRVAPAGPAPAASTSSADLSTAPVAPAAPIAAAVAPSSQVIA